MDNSGPQLKLHSYSYLIKKVKKHRRRKNLFFCFEKVIFFKSMLLTHLRQNIKVEVAIAAAGAVKLAKIMAVKRFYDKSFKEFVF